MTVRYGARVVLDGVRWTVRAGENWVVRGANGAGKSTLIDLVTGENPQAFREPVALFGRRRGSGESVWDIKARLGLLSTASHMAYADFASGGDARVLSLIHI